MPMQTAFESSLGNLECNHRHQAHFIATESTTRERRLAEDTITGCHRRRFRVWREWACCAGLGLGLLLATHVQGQLRIVTYNTATAGSGSLASPRSGMDVVLAGIGNESTGGIAKRIDVLLLQEQASHATSTQQMVNLLNGLYGAGTYAKATLNPTSWGSGSPGMIYNTNTVQLMQQSLVGQNSQTGMVRQGTRYRVRPVGYDANADFYLYSNHYKASAGSSNESRRLVEANIVRSNADALGDGQHIIYAGDFNIQSSSESMYQRLLSTGPGQAFDPINRPGNWHNRSSDRDLHTQSPYNPSNGYPELIGGGLDDRFDFQVVSGEFLDREGLSYIPNSYHTFGNNGTHSLNDYIDDSSNTALPRDVLNALASVSDHLPVVADYQVPAIMNVTVDPVVDRVLPGGILNARVTVDNAANVVATIGADELDYQINVTGAASGSISGTDFALGGGQSHLFALDTSSTGSYAASINVQSSSQSVANGTFDADINYQVVERSNPSFQMDSDVDQFAVDFGIVAPGTPTMATLDLWNIASDGSAALDIDSIFSFGDDTVFLTNLAPTDNIAAGDAIQFDITMDSSATAENYEANFLFQLSDEDLPGIQSGYSLNLNVTGSVALPGDANLDGFVDASDFAIWNTNKFTTGNSWTTGDFTGDGLVDTSDFNVWNSHRFTGLDPRLVPEPSLPHWLAIGLLGLLRQVKRRVR